MEKESKKVWHYKERDVIYMGCEPLCIERTKNEALEKIKKKKGIEPIEILEDFI